MLKNLALVFATLCMSGAKVICNHDLNLTIADQPAVKFGLLSAPHVRYLMEIKSQVNPQSRNLKLLYPAIGPDLATELLATDATEIYGIDLISCRPDHFLEYLEEYSPGAGRSWWSEAQSNPSHALQNQLRYRRRGYWDRSPIYASGIPALIALEMSLLGIDKNSIRATPETHGTKFEFLWAYPGAKAKLRILHYIHSHIDEVIESPQWYGIPKVDIFYLKSGIELQKNSMATIQKMLGLAKKILKPKGAASILYGMPFGEKQELDGFAAMLKPLRLDVRKIQSGYDTDDDDSYAWRMNIFTR